MNVIRYSVRSWSKSWREDSLFGSKGSCILYNQLGLSSRTPLLLLSQLNAIRQLNPKPQLYQSFSFRDEQKTAHTNNNIKIRVCCFTIWFLWVQMVFTSNRKGTREARGEERSKGGAVVATPPFTNVPWVQISGSTTLICLSWLSALSSHPLKPNIWKFQFDEEWQAKNHFGDVLPPNRYSFIYLLDYIARQPLTL